VEVAHKQDIARTGVYHLKHKVVTFIALIKGFSPMEDANALPGEMDHVVQVPTDLIL
jgi:hypothetical protein